MDSYDVLITLSILVRFRLRNRKEIQLSTKVRHTLHHRSAAVDNPVNHTIAISSLKIPTTAMPTTCPMGTIKKGLISCDLSVFER